MRASSLPPDLTWIDHTGLKDVAFVQTVGAPRGRALEQLFWNRSVTRVVLLGPADATDAFGAAPINVTGDGRMVAGREPITGPILFESFAARAEFTGARSSAAASASSSTGPSARRASRSSSTGSTPTAGSPTAAGSPSGRTRADAPTAR